MKKKSKSKQQNIFMKVGFYIMSLSILFFLLAIKTAKRSDITFAELCVMLKDIQNIILNLTYIDKILPVIFLALALFGIVLMYIFKHIVKGVTNPGLKIKSIKNENYEYLAFLTTYIISFVGFDFEGIISSCIFFAQLFLIGLILIKMDLFWANPTLAIFGYKIYRIEVADANYKGERLVVTKDNLSQGDIIEWLPFDNNSWYVRRIK